MSFVHKILVSSLLILSGCGFNGNQRVTQGGESYTYVVLRLEFIQQVRELCEQRTLRSDFESDELYEQEVASCTIDNLALLNINIDALGEFQDSLCREDADLSSFSPEEQQDILAACTALGG